MQVAKVVQRIQTEAMSGRQREDDQVRPESGNGGHEVSLPVQVTQNADTASSRKTLKQVAPDNIKHV